jgi:hypothetical protein
VSCSSIGRRLYSQKNNRWGEADEQSVELSPEPLHRPTLRDGSMRAARENAGTRELAFASVQQYVLFKQCNMISLQRSTTGCFWPEENPSFHSKLQGITRRVTASGVTTPLAYRRCRE